MDQYKATEQAYKNGYAKGYADGVKEFAEKLEERYGNIPMWGAVAVVYMEQILKEMVGADNGNG
jgi:flagellar biosynthesis/type III secretory pathway protein FliH